MALSKNSSADIREIIEDAELELSNQEEIFLRLRHGLNASEEPLKRKTDDKKLLSRLLELERSIIKKALDRSKK